MRYADLRPPPSPPAHDTRFGGHVAGAQAKWKIGSVDDPLEREADRVAEAITQSQETMPQGAVVRGAEHASPAPAIRRQCSACAGKEEELVLTKGDARGPVASGAERAAEALAEGGTAMSSAARAFFEPRFGRDFSGVRVHHDARAADAADAIHARAFTLGNDIAFARGEYAPSTREGSKLLAHELAHVVQGGGRVAQNVIARQPAPVRQRTFQDRSGGGTTDLEETVQNAPTQNGTIITGRVDRREFAPATATAPRQDISPQGHVDVQFDTQTCAVTVPHTFNFVPQATANRPICQEPPNATAVPPFSAAQVQQLGQRYVDTVNEGMQGRFTARISGCKNKCADRDIPIRSNATLNATNPDTTMRVVNRGGRGDAGTICAADMRSDFPVHESGHQVLAMGDEYREEDPGLRQRNPTWARDERVRTDLTRMGSDVDYGRFSLFQERHFRFAQVFLEAAFPGCTVTLQAVPRRVPDFRIEGLLGGASLPGGSGFYAGLGANIGLPLTRMRQLELRLGAQGIYLMTMPPIYRSALLVGATIGLEGRTSSAGFAGSFGAFASGGLYHQFASDGIGSTPPTLSRTSGYAEGGLSLGILSGMMGRVNLGLRVDAAVGTEITRDPDAMRWLRFGAALGGTF